MRILLTNDDGIYSDGIYALYKELKKIGSVTVVAPDSQRSSVGHAITIASPICIKRIVQKRKFTGYGLSGTPADCVKYAVRVLLKQKPDLVVSGINLGPNDGCSVFYSGTIGAAREGSLYGIPSIAVSLDTFQDPYYAYAAKVTAILAKRIRKFKMPTGTFLNVNVPNLPKSKIKGLRVTEQGEAPFLATFTQQKDTEKNKCAWMSCMMPRQERNKKSDTAILSRQYISITPLQNNLTDFRFIKALQNCLTL